MKDKVNNDIPARFRLESYRYRLPQGQIAQHPLDDRAASRLLILDRHKGVTAHEHFRDLPDHLHQGDCLVINDTRVIPARLFAHKPAGGLVELLTVRVEGPTFISMYGTHRKLKPGTVLTILDRDRNPTNRTLEVGQLHPDGTATLTPCDEVPPLDLLTEYGHVPLPPYIHREDDSLHDIDSKRYQTVYALFDGSVAAPTAGLHFTDSLLDRLTAMGVETHRVTLHVGPGTFRPIKTLDIREHQVGLEAFNVPTSTADAVNSALAQGRRIIAVGTTVVRTLETAGSSGRLRAGSGTSNLFVCPGFHFNIVSGMVTNFHLPGSSLLALVSAFAGRTRVMSAYRLAVREGYRFYSYGDAMLVT